MFGKEKKDEGLPNPDDMLNLIQGFMQISPDEVVMRFLADPNQIAKFTDTVIINMISNPDVTGVVAGSMADAMIKLGSTILAMHHRLLTEEGEDTPTPKDILERLMNTCPLEGEKWEELVQSYFQLAGDVISRMEGDKIPDEIPKDWK